MARELFAFESLEHRRLMSAATLSSGELIVNGDINARNQIVVSTGANDLTVEVTFNGGAAQSFLKLLVTSITVTGGGKSDNISISETNGVLNVPITLFGKRGNDTLRGDVTRVTLMGGSENDSLYGGAAA